VRGITMGRSIRALSDTPLEVSIVRRFRTAAGCREQINEQRYWGRLQRRELAVVKFAQRLEDRVVL